MKCPECKGHRSLISVNITSSTTMGITYYYDEDGRFHCHDPNRITMECFCNHGHKWTDRTKIGCWCGWPTDFIESGALCKNCRKVHPPELGILIIMTEINFKHKKSETRHLNFCRRECREDYFNKFTV